MTSSQHVYEIRPRKDKRGVDLISDALPFGRLWYTKPDDAVGYAKFFSRSHDTVIRVFDEKGSTSATRKPAGAQTVTLPQLSNFGMEIPRGN